MSSLSTLPDKVNPDEKFGTLAQKAERKKDRKGLIYHPRQSRNDPRSSRGASLDVSDALADVEHFTNLIDDKIITFSDLVTVPVSEKSGKFTILCDVSENSSPLEMIPTGAFLQSVSRWANSHTHIKSMTYGFLASLIDSESIQARNIAADVLNYAFQQLSTTYRDKEDQAKRVMLRTLEPDKSGRWPVHRSARAVLHEKYRDDISHQWIMKLMSGLVPGGRVERFYFDGDLLKGAIIVPDVARVEEDSEYEGGLFFFSGEVGNRRAGVMPFIYRAVTSSVVLLPDSNWNVSHKGTVDCNEHQNRLTDFVHEHIPLVSTNIDRMVRSRDITFDESDNFVVERLLIALGHIFGPIPQRDLRLWHIGVLAEKAFLPAFATSVMTIQNGLTRMAQTLDDPLRQMQFEQMAGRLLGLNWENIVARAKTVSDDQVARVFKLDDGESTE